MPLDPARYRPNPFGRIHTRDTRAGNAGLVDSPGTFEPFIASPTMTGPAISSRSAVDHRHPQHRLRNIRHPLAARRRQQSTDHPNLDRRRRGQRRTCRRGRERHRSRNRPGLAPSAPLDLFALRADPTTCLFRQINHCQHRAGRHVVSTLVRARRCQSLNGDRFQDVVPPDDTPRRPPSASSPRPHRFLCALFRVNREARP